MRTLIVGTLALLMSVPVSNLMAAEESENDTSNIAKVLDKAEDKKPLMRPLPMVTGILAVKDDKGKTTFVSYPNARFAFQGVIYDSWSRRKIKNYDQVNESYMVPMEVAGIDTAELATFTLGNPSIKKMGTIFVDSISSKRTKTYLTTISTNAEKYHFEVVMLATMSKGSQKRFKQLWCAKDQNLALADLVLGQDKTKGAPGKKVCDTDVMFKGAITQNILNIKGMPFTMRADGLMYTGVPKDLDAWLRYDIHAQEKK